MILSDIWFLSSNDGQSIITSSADDQIIIYDCEKGTQKRVLNSKKYCNHSSYSFSPSHLLLIGMALISFTSRKTKDMQCTPAPKRMISSGLRRTHYSQMETIKALEALSDWIERSLCSGTCPWRKTSTSATLADMTRELSPWLWIPLMRLFCLAGCYTWDVIILMKKAPIIWTIYFHLETFIYEKCKKQ